MEPLDPQFVAYVVLGSIFALIAIMVPVIIVLLRKKETQSPTQKSNKSLSVSRKGVKSSRPGLSKRSS